MPALLTALMLTLLLVGAGLALPSPGFPVILALCLIVLLTAPKLIYRLARQAPAPRAEVAERTALLVGQRRKCPSCSWAPWPAPPMPRRTASSACWALSARHTGRRVHGLDVIGAAEQAEAVLAKLAAAGRAPDLLIVTAPEFTGDALAALLATAETFSVRVLRAPNLTSLAPADAAEKIALQPIAIEDLLNRRQVALDRAGMARLVAGRRVLVTGAGGSIGAELARQVAALRPAELLLLDNGEYALWQIDLELAELHPNAATPGGDRRCAGRRHAWLKSAHDFRPELVFHAAAPEARANRRGQPAGGPANQCSGHPRGGGRGPRRRRQPDGADLHRQGGQPHLGDGCQQAAGGRCIARAWMSRPGTTATRCAA